MLGYHGHEIRFYDELLGGKGQWRNVGQPDAAATSWRCATCCSPRRSRCRDFTRCSGPVTTTPGRPAVLLERDTLPPFVRVVPGARSSSPRTRWSPTVIDPRFPFNLGRPLSGHGSADTRADPGGQVPDAVAVRPTLAEWAPGRMRITLAGAAAKPAYLADRRELVSRLARHGGRQARAGLPGRPHAPERRRCRRARGRSTLHFASRGLRAGQAGDADGAARDARRCWRPPGGLGGGRAAHG